MHKKSSPPKRTVARRGAPRRACNALMATVFQSCSCGDVSVPAEFKRRQTCNDVERNRALKRERLERDSSVGAANQNVSPGTQTNADIAADANIFARKRAGEQARGRPKHHPAQHAAGTDSHAPAGSVDRPVIRLDGHRRLKSGRPGETAI